MNRRSFLSQSIAVSAFAGLTRGRALADAPTGWDQVPGILARVDPPTFPDRDFNILDYGAKSGGVFDCRTAFAAAIAACNQAGGGRVVVPTGAFLVNGPIRLLSDVNLFLEAGAIVRFGADPSFYLPVVETRWQGIRCMNYSPFIRARNQRNIAVTGYGMFDGQAGIGWYAWLAIQMPDWEALQKMARDGVPVAERVFGSGHYLRPTLFEPYQCNNILVEGVTFSTSPFWTIHPTFCTNVTIRGVNVLPGVTNDDGCDPDSCQDVLIEGCSFETADDNISIKAGSGPDAIGSPPCSNIVIRNCRTISSDWSAYTMGSSTTGNIENVFIENCTANNCIVAFYIKSDSDLGGIVKNVWVRQFKVGRCHHLVYLQTNYNYIAQGPSPPLFENINLEYVTCADATVSALWFDGDYRRPIQGVTLDTVAIGKTSKLDKISDTIDIRVLDLTVGGKPAKLTA